MRVPKIAKHRKLFMIRALLKAGPSSGKVQENNIMQRELMASSNETPIVQSIGYFDFS